jgi:acyl-CoA reductase-like NAD-dependent aldehyde dehydrogenase
MWFQLSADRFASIFATAGLPQDLLVPLHLSPKLTRYVAAHAGVSFVSFTGSVSGGEEVQRAALDSVTIGFKGVALEVRCLFHDLQRPEMN